MNITKPTLDGMLLPCALLLTALAAPALAEEYVKSYAVTDHPTVHIRVDDSKVHVTTSDSGQVEFRVTAEGFAAINIGGKLHVDSQQNGNEVELSVRVSPSVTIGFNNRRLRTEVRMPRNADLQIDSSDGHVELSDLKGNVVVRTSDGGIKASQLSGSIELRSKDGDIDADALAGTFKLHSGDGRISAMHLDGNCDVSSSDGSIEVGGRFDSLDIKSSDGAVTARAESGSKMSSAWSVKTTDGRVDVTIPKDLKASLDASTRDGHITLGLPVSVEGDLGRKAVHGTINGGGPTLSIRTGDGSIRLNGI